MPYVNIKITDEGVTEERLQRLIEGTTQLLVDTLAKDPATTHVVIDMVPMNQWGVRGKAVNVLRREAAENPQ